MAAHTHVFFHSPFSLYTHYDATHCALLLQFILKELIALAERKECIEQKAFCLLPHNCHPLAKIKEQMSLLETAFPNHLETISQFKKAIHTFSSHQESKRCISLLKPLIESCGEEENLLFFLLQNYSYCHPFFMHKDLEEIKRLLCHKYEQRGFKTLAQKIEHLVAQIAYAPL